MNIFTREEIRENARLFEVESLDELRRKLMSNEKSLSKLTKDIFNLCEDYREEKKEIKAIRKTKRQKMKKARKLQDRIERQEETICELERKAGARSASENVAEETSQTNHMIG